MALTLLVVVLLLILTWAVCLASGSPRLERNAHFVFGAALCVLFASRDIPLALDDASYVTHPEAAVFGIQTMSEHPSGWLGVIVEEPVYTFLCAAANYFVTGEQFVRLLIFVSLAILVIATAKLRHKLLFLVFVSVSAWLSDLYYLHLRQGLAFSILALAFRFRAVGPRFAIVVFAGLIHTSVLLMVPILFYDEISRLLFKSHDGWRLVFFVVVVAVLAQLIDFDVMNSFEHRRSGLELEGAQRNITYIAVPIAWSLLAFALKGRVDALLFQFVLGMVLCAFIVNVPWSSRVHTNYQFFFAAHLASVHYQARYKYVVLHGTYLVYLGYWALRAHPVLALGS